MNIKIDGDYSFLYSEHCHWKQNKRDFEYEKLWDGIIAFSTRSCIDQATRVNIDKKNPDIKPHTEYICNENMYLKGNILHISATGFSTVISGIKL